VIVRCSPRVAAVVCGSVLGALVGVVAWLVPAPHATARPVRIGRYVEIPYGFRVSHPCPMLGCDAGRSGRLRGRFPDLAPARLWRQQTAQPVVDDGLAQPLVLAGDLVIVAELGGIEALTRGGTRAFLAEIGAPASINTLAVTPADEFVAVTGRGDVLLVTRDGTVRARTRLSSGIRGAPLVLADGTIVVSTGDGLRGLDATLAPVFSLPLDAGGAGAPALARDGRIAVVSGAELVLVDAEGRGAQHVELGGRALEHVAVAPDGTFWAFVAPGEIVAVDASARVRARGANGVALDGAPIVAADGTVRAIVRSRAGRPALAAISATGRTLWERELAGVAKGLALDEAGTTIVALQSPMPTGPGTTNVAPVGELVAIGADGEVRWRIATEGVPLGAPVRGDEGALYLLVGRGRTYIEAYGAAASALAPSDATHRAMHSSELDYELPEALIASEPLPERDGARLLLVERGVGPVADRQVRELPGLLPPSLFIVNDTRVIPARLHAEKASGGKVELLLVRRLDVENSPSTGTAGNDERWEAMARGLKSLRDGAVLRIGDALIATVLRRGAEDTIELALRPVGLASVEAALARVGELPLPPYLRREARPVDDERYQTIFATKAGAVAAPTAGLHLSERLLEDLATAGHTLARITLHVGPGTFLPLRSDELSEHAMHAEHYEVTTETAAAINEARAAGRPIVAVGTTVVRTLESAAQQDDSGHFRVTAGGGATRLFIYPPTQLNVVDALFTNFHLPKSTLLALVMAFAGIDPIRRAYAHAIAERYRFFSYGDAMLIRAPQ